MRRITIILSAISCLLAVSCDKEKKAEEATPAELAVVVENAKDIYESPKNLSVSLNLAVAADPVSEEAYTITLGPKPGLVASYNTAHGTSYESLPSSAYTLSSSTLMLTKYSPKSTSAELKLKGDGCEQDKTYILPIGIESVQGGTNFHAPDDKVAFIIFKVTAPEQQGSGKSGDPYIIEDLEGFLKIGSMMQDEATVYFKLAADIDFADVKYTEESPWAPFNYASTDEAIAIAEKRIIDLDGNGHKISNFKAGGALFGILVGSVQNLSIENAEITCLSGNVGAILAGSAKEATIKNVSIKKSKISNDYKRSGALVSWFKSGTVENVDVECDITGDQQIGGLIGRVEEGTIINCSANGTIEANSYYAGGLIGYAEKVNVQGCNASGKVSASGNYVRAGGLIGEIHGGSVEKSFATVDVEGPNGHFAGAFIGVADAATADITVSKSYATGSASYLGTGNKAGYAGFIGRMEKGNLTVNDCYSTGAVKAFRWSGGFIGDINKGNLTINNGYTTSDISAIGPDGNGAYQRGLVIGQIRNADETVVNCSKFIAWKTTDDAAFCFPDNAASLTGNYYGNEGTVSQQAKNLNWDTTIWDLGGNLPKLK